MYFIHLETYHIIPALVGGFILFFGLVSSFVKERIFLSEALVAFLFGITIGPIALGFFNPLEFDGQHTFTLEFSRICIAIQVFAAGVSLPKKYMLKEWKSLAVLLLPVMFLTWVVSGAIIYAFLPISFLEALVIASCITPTDPVLANSIVKGRFAENHVPEHVRDVISAESGANDGLGFPYLFFAIFMLKSETTSEALLDWFGLIWGYQILLSLIIGIAAGYIGRKLLQYCHRHNTVDKESFLAFWIALALFLMGTMAIIGSDDLFCCFVAGNSFTWDDWFRIETKEADIQDIVDMIFNFSFFIYLGSSIPWSEFSLTDHNLSISSLFCIGVLIILFRRIPGILLAKPFIPAFHNWREAIFAGWFGPIGVGGIFYALVAVHELNTYETKLKVTPFIYPTVVFLVICSIIVHGTTIPLFYIGKQIKTRSTATGNAVANLVTRLPTLIPGQELIIRQRRSNRDAPTDEKNIGDFALQFPDSFNKSFSGKLDVDITIVESEDTLPPVLNSRRSFGNQKINSS